MELGRDAVRAPVVAPPVGIQNGKEMVAEYRLVRAREELVDRQPDPERRRPTSFTPLLRIRPAVRQGGLHSATSLLFSSQKKSSAVLTASERRCFIVRASGDKYQTIAKPPITPIVPTASNVTVPH